MSFWQILLDLSKTKFFVRSIILGSYQRQRSLWRTFVRLINLDCGILTYQSWIELWRLDLSIVDWGVYSFDWVLIKEGHLCGESSFAYQSARLWRISSLSYFAFFTLILIVLYRRYSNSEKIGIFPVRILSH